MVSIEKVNVSILALALTGAAASLAASPAFAASTALTGPSGASITHQDIFNLLYGGGFNASGLDFSNGSITATRVDDNADKSFNFASFSATAKGRFAQYDQQFGVIGSDGQFQELFDVQGRNTNVTGSVSDVQIAGDFLFARNGTGGLVTSDPILNRYQDDGMVTYLIDGLDGVEGITLLLFFEDIPGFGPARDFNDLIVEVVGQSPASNPLPIPSPAAGGAGLIMLGALAFRRRLI